jgi:pimeloyl-ACP methyl ester carboxylesterase
MKPTRHDFSAPHQHIDVGHSQLAYYRFGQGPDLVFVHGWPLSAATFRRLTPLLAEHFTCHLFDLPGTGNTKWDRRTPVGLREHADTLGRAIETLSIERYALLGHDSGAAIMRLLAADAPEHCWGLVMGNTEIPGHRPLLVELYGLLAKIPGGAAAFALALKSRAVRRSALGYGGCFADMDMLDGDFHDLFVEPLLSDKRALAGQMRLVHGLDFGIIDKLEQTHAHISAPALLLWGVDDPFFPLDKARGMLAQFPGGAELIEIEPGKLFAHEEFPALFAEHARRFLLSVAASGAAAAASAA